MKTREFFLALAVAAAAIATSCVKEQIEEPQGKPEVEITGQVFEANHEVLTKSTLVDLTPTWVEGDQIFVSGSDEDATCTFVEGNTFQTEEGKAVQAPFYAVYSAGEGNTVNRETGVFTASIPSLQKIDVDKDQNVAQGALVAVAQSETPQLQFKNAVGLVKINIARNDIMAVKIEGLGENEFVAGQFTMKLNGDEEPEIALVEGTGVTSVTLNTVENYGMFTPGEYYATVLPCNLSGIKVTFSRKTFTYDENGEVTGTGSETISVQKQSSAEIKRNAGTNLGTFFTYEISTADELVAWNKAKAKWTVWDVVTLKDNIDCSTIESEDWTPNEFKGVFDGNGKTIDNLVIEKASPAAFFSRLASATVKNLTFGDGCSFTATAPWEGYATKIYAASLAADITGNTALTNVVNKGTVKTSTGATGGATGNYVGGICAYYRATGNVSGCQNYGEVSFPATPAGHVWCGGIFGYTETGASIANCTNHGHVLFNGTNSGNKSLYLGGITAEAKTASFNTCVNLGAVDVNATAAHGGHAFMGGIVGVNDEGKLGEIVGCVNGSETDFTKGAVTNNSNTSGVLRIGGFIGYIVTNASDIANTSGVSCFKNYGTITNKAEIGNWAGIGGVAGYVGALAAENTITGCENHGTVVNEKVKAKMNVGGIVGFIQDANTTVTGCKNHGEVKNTGTSPSGIGVTVAGIVGRIEARTDGTNTISLCENHGVISYAAKNESDGTYFSGAAGILGGHTGKSGTGAATVTVDQCKNLGTVTKSENGNSNLFIGGIAGFFSGTEKSASHVANVTGCTNGVVNDATKGEITNASISNGDWFNYTGGIVGYHRISGKIEGCENYSAVTNKATSSKYDGIRLGGIAGSVAMAAMTNCSNFGEVSDKSNSPAGLIGGVIGQVSGTGMTITNCDNAGQVSGLFNNTSSKDVLAVGGIVGNTVGAATVTMSLCDNTGNISQYNTVTGTLECVGGLVAYAYGTVHVSDCSSNAVVFSARDNYQYVGALFGRIYPTASTVKTTKVYGTFDGKELNADNYTIYCYGTGSGYKDTSDITYGKDN